MESILKNSLHTLQIEQTVLNENFFSNKNLDFIQKNLMTETRRRTGQTISKQNCTEIVNIMQYFFAMYPQYTMVSPTYIENINNLNNLVINELLKMTVSGVKQYMGYIKDISTNRNPIEYGKPTGIKGDNQLIMPSFDI